MIYTKKTQLAMQIAYKAHEGQYDKANVPYVFHSFHIAEEMTTEKECITALLHDVLEDTSITAEELSRYFDNEVVEAIKLLSRNKKESYKKYIEKIKPNDLARKVKIADLKHNCTMSRLSKVTVKDLVRLAKYNKAIKYLRK